MSFANEDHTRRLDRARRQYENLLIHAGEVLIENDPGLNDTNVFEGIYSPQRQRDVRFQSPVAQKVHKSVVDDSFEYENTSLGMDKDTVILSLQEEIERLRNKLESVVSSVETVIQDAQMAQDEIKEEHDRQLYELNKRYARLEDENRQLRVTLDLSQAQLAVEQDNLLKAAKFIERLKRRGREYVDVQRKSHSLLVTTSALCSSTSAAVAHSKEKLRASSSSSETGAVAATAGGGEGGRRRHRAEPVEDAAEEAYHSSNNEGGEGYHNRRGERHMEIERHAAAHMYPASAMKASSASERR